MTSFDRHAFDFQGIGEYTLARTLRGTPWEVQVRMLSHENPPEGKPVCKDVSWATALATSLGTHRLGVYIEGSVLKVLWDGQPIDLGSVDVPKGAVVEQIGTNAWFFKWPEGHELKVTRAGRGILSIGITPAPSALGNVVGLLGRFDGDPSNDFTARDGAILAHPISFKNLYKTFGDSWRVTASNSLFGLRARRGASPPLPSSKGQALRWSLGPWEKSLMASWQDAGSRASGTPYGFKPAPWMPTVSRQQ